MPERLDHVTISTGYGDREISWSARDDLLREIRHLESGKPVVKAFEAVGASRPIKLDDNSKGLLVEAIHVMSNNAGGIDKIDPELVQLRHALVDELDAKRRAE
jgi:hypothetical protein